MTTAEVNHAVKRCQFYRDNLRAAMADYLGYVEGTLSPDQEKLVTAIQDQPRVCAMGGAGTGKSFVYGVAAALKIAFNTQSKGFFGGPRREQTALLSWLEFQRTHDRARVLGRPLGGQLDSYTWQGPEYRDWFAVCMAMSERDNAAGVSGMAHATGGIYVVLEELNGVHPDVRDALYAGTTQADWHMWASFNPMDPNDAAAHFWHGTPAAGRVQLSALACAEWSARTGTVIPGMPTLEAIREKWEGHEHEPLYYAKVLGEFPPSSAQFVIVPKDWYDKCTNCIPAPEPRDLRQTGMGVDTGGGYAETGACAVVGRVVLPIRAHKTGHDTLRASLAIREFAGQVARRLPIAVDWIGTGGKGVGEQLRNDGCRVLVFRGGARTLTELVAVETEHELAKCPDLYADNITWAYFGIRDAARLTVEAIDAGRPDRYISFPPDPILRDQLARGYKPNREQRYKLDQKDSTNSPDRADMAAEAWLAAHYRHLATAVGMAQTDKYRYGMTVGHGAPVASVATIIDDEVQRERGEVSEYDI